MSQGFDVSPDELRRGAADLRADAEALDAARIAASSAAQAAGRSVGGGPLVTAAMDFAAQMDRAAASARRGIEAAASALEASATTYITDDRHVAEGMPNVVIPGLGEPR